MRYRAYPNEANYQFTGEVSQKAEQLIAERQQRVGNKVINFMFGE